VDIERVHQQHTTRPTALHDDYPTIALRLPYASPTPTPRARCSAPFGVERRDRPAGARPAKSRQRRRPPPWRAKAGQSWARALEEPASQRSVPATAAPPRRAAVPARPTAQQASATRRHQRGNAADGKRASARRGRPGAAQPTAPLQRSRAALACARGWLRRAQAPSSHPRALRSGDGGSTPASPRLRAASSAPPRRHERGSSRFRRFAPRVSVSTSRAAQ
jgi:hypothetical protein